MPRTGQRICGVSSIGTTGWAALVGQRGLGVTAPPQQSTAASSDGTLAAARYANRPPEQKPMHPTFPFEVPRAFSQPAAASMSPIA
jgi:hypothetical protein